MTEFIHQQPVFFVATAPANGRVNCSPKGMDALRVVGPNRLLWLNVTGSGNETAAHVKENGRMTLMWCAFTGPPLILRVYGEARAVHPGDVDWAELSGQLPTIPGARQVFDLTITMVQTSCGKAVPLMDYREDRSELWDWA
ncbi:MAG: pyridoxamine 5'-phosphate oxidase family protein, partial [Bacteroidota bacterium]